MACCISDCTECKWWGSGTTKVCPECGGKCRVEFDEEGDHPPKNKRLRAEWEAMYEEEE